MRIICITTHSSQDPETLASRALGMNQQAHRHVFWAIQRAKDQPAIACLAFLGSTNINRNDLYLYIICKLQQATPPHGICARRL